MMQGQMPRPKIAVLDAYSMFLLERRARNVSPRTLSYYNDQLRPFCAWLDGDGVDVAGITPHHVRLFVTELQERKLSDWTVHGVARAIRAFLRFCVDEGMIDAAPRMTMPKLEKKILPAFNLDQLKAILKACKKRRDRSIVLFLLDTGLRAEELMALESGDINFNDGSVTVRVGKGGKQRTVYASARTLRELQRYWAESGKPLDGLWASRTGRRLTVWGLMKLLKRLGKRANVPHCHPHTFRRTFALMALRNGMNIYALQRLLGHSSIEMVRRYLDLTETDLAAAHKQAGVIDGLL